MIIYESIYNGIVCKLGFWTKMGNQLIQQNLLKQQGFNNVIQINMILLLYYLQI